LAFESVPLKDLFAYLKDSPKRQGNACIIGLYTSFLIETTHKNYIAINGQKKISIYLSKGADPYPLKPE
ncbi:hypothetical protein OFM39_24145, partial [Escherichia coli]|nr:hypothetical protein [Escherichia coli]